MIEIISVEISNIRSIGETTFAPLGIGSVTALHGPNGAGKSSILTAMLWALYGVTPDQVPVKAMRRQGSDGDCRVKVTFVHDGQRVAVERGLKGLKDATYAKTWVEGVEQSIASSKAATAWIISRFGGLDAEGFKTAFVVEQEELNGLVRAKPSERRQLIERLAGIERMSAAVKTARAEEGDAKKTLDLMPGSAEQVTAARAALEVAQGDAGDAWQIAEEHRAAVEDAERTLMEAESSATEISHQVEEHRAAADHARTAGHTLDRATDRADAARATVERLTEQAVGGTETEVAAARAAFGAARAAADLNRDALAKAERATADATAAQRRAEQVRLRANTARAGADRAASAAAQARTVAETFPADLADQIRTAQDTADRLAASVGALRGEFDRLAGSIKALNATTEPHCPTCATSLADPAALLATLQTAQERVKADGAQAAAEQKQAATLLTDLRAQAQAAATATERAGHLAAQAATAETDAAATEQDAEAAEAEAVTALAAAESASTAAADAARDADAIRAAVDTAAAVLRRAESAAEAADRLAAATAEADAHAAAVLDAATAKAGAERAERDLRVPEQTRRQAQDAYQQALIVCRDVAARAAEATATFRIANERAERAERERDAAEEHLKARAAQFEIVELATATREALDTFRKDRIARIAPELSEVATDFVVRMTDGKYVGVELDEEFTPIVTHHTGWQRPAALLSGGEVSVVALALRLAIGELIAGERGGLLFLDEAQTALDAERRQAQMAAIRDLPGRQVISISHSAEATDVADAVFALVPHDEDGSTLVAEVEGFLAAISDDLDDALA